MNASTRARGASSSGLTIASPRSRHLSRLMTIFRSTRSWSRIRHSERWSKSRRPARAGRSQARRPIEAMLPRGVFPPGSSVRCGAGLGLLPRHRHVGALVDGLFDGASKVGKGRMVSVVEGATFDELPLYHLSLLSVSAGWRDKRDDRDRRHNGSEA
jgi:hypothetical protein